VDVGAVSIIPFMASAAVDASSTREAILAVLRALPDDDSQAERVIATIPSTRDAWQQLIDQATAHGVLGVMGPLLRRTLLPADIHSEIERRLAVQNAWQLHVAASLERTVVILTNAGVRACALKGPALAERLYRRPEERPSMDIDLLVMPGDLRKASAALQAAGYAADDPANGAYLLEHGHHLHFAQRGQPDVELHFHAYAGFGVILPASALFERAREHRLGRQHPVLVPAVEDEFLYLSAHAAGHSFIRLLWLYDLKLLLQHDAVDWVRVFDRAGAGGLATALAYTLRLLRDWLGLEVPQPLQRGPLRVRLADYLLAEASRPSTPGTRDNLGGLLFTSMLCDRVTASGWLLQHHLLRTTRRRLQRLAPQLLPARWAG
jgi:hypothetical protein